ncbi:MAG TPA: ABC transporter permease [Rhodanobacter sp.]|nr:ABC transporter permease [Rhodanobacter sp.]
MNSVSHDVFSITRLEWRRLATRPLSWVLLALTLAWMAWIYLAELGAYLASQMQLAAHPDGTGYIDHVVMPLVVWLVILFTVITPLLTMSSIADERRNGTLPLLFGSGVSSLGIVLGKYLATLTWLWGGLCVIFAMAVMLPIAHSVPLDWGWLAAVVLGLALMLATMTAVGIACSAFSPHPVIAAAVAIVLLLALWLGNAVVQMSGMSNAAVNWLMVSSHVQPMLRGQVSSGDVIWLLLLVLVALVLAARRVTVDKERG